MPRLYDSTKKDPAVTCRGLFYCCKFWWASRESNTAPMDYETHHLFAAITTYKSQEIAIAIYRSTNAEKAFGCLYSHRSVQFTSHNNSLTSSIWRIKNPHRTKFLYITQTAILKNQQKNLSYSSHVIQIRLHQKESPTQAAVQHTNQ